MHYRFFILSLFLLKIVLKAFENNFFGVVYFWREGGGGLKVFEGVRPRYMLQFTSWSIKIIFNFGSCQLFNSSNYDEAILKQ